MDTATLTCQIVRPDRLLYEGEATSVILIGRNGEVGIFPHHAAEILALGNGEMRINRPEDADGAHQLRVLTMGGYAEVDDDTVIVLATHARFVDDIDRDVVLRTRGEVVAKRDALDEGDHERAYYDEKIAWCDLLLSVSAGSSR